MKRVINNSLFFSLCACAILVCAQAAVAAEPLKPIARVQELAQQPLITLKTGDQIRLGIGPLDPEIGPWRIIYCSLEKAGEPQPMHDKHGGEVLGPVFVRCDWAEQKFMADGVSAFQRLTNDHKVFRHAIPLTRNGKATIHVYDTEGTDIATMDMDVKAMPLAWRRFSNRNKTVLAVPATMSATSLQAEAEAPLKLSLEVGSFRIDAGERTMDNSPDLLAARWWVNGELQIPPQVVQQEQMQQAMARQVRNLSVLNVPFHLPEDLKLRAGDKVTVQVMYNAGGWKQPPLEGMAMQMLRQAIASGSDKNVSYVMSNRLEFVVTKEMLP